MPERTAPLDLPDDVVQAAAGRANDENVSLTEVTAALLREYADGSSWMNQPAAEDASGEGFAARLAARIRKVHCEKWRDEAARRGMLTGLLVAREMLRESAGLQRRSLPEALQSVLDEG